MDDFDKSTNSLIERELTRKQFLGLVGTTFLGMFALFRVAEKVLNGPLKDDLATSAQGLFGERQYGGDEEPSHAYNHKESTY